MPLAHAHRYITCIAIQLAFCVESFLYSTGLWFGGWLTNCGNKYHSIVHTFMYCTCTIQEWNVSHNLISVEFICLCVCVCVQKTFVYILKAGSHLGTTVCVVSQSWALQCNAASSAEIKKIVLFLRGNMLHHAAEHCTRIFMFTSLHSYVM